MPPEKLNSPFGQPPAGKEPAIRTAIKKDIIDYAKEEPEKYSKLGWLIARSDKDHAEEVWKYVRENDISDEAVRSLAKRQLGFLIKTNEPNEAKALVKNFDIPQADVEESAKEAFLSHLPQRVDMAIDDAKIFPLPEHFIEEFMASEKGRAIAEKSIFEMLSHGAGRTAAEAVEFFQIPANRLDSWDFQEALRQCAARMLTEGYSIAIIVEIAKKFHTPL